MVDIPKPYNCVESLIDKHHEDNQELPRPHFGLSQVGHHCERWLWLSFRWAVIPKFEGRLLRLFRRGHNEEHTIVKDLRAIGINVKFGGYNQYSVSFGSHVKGSLDGIIDYGVPQAPRKKHILEIKTHNLKSFDELEKIGVEKAKPMHYAQMQAYMLGSKIDRALYIAVCKNDDRLYSERVKLDKKLANKLIDKAKRIAMSEEIPAPISTDKTWYQCKMCDAHDFCHGSKMTKEVNCRTCAHVTVKENDTFYCERWKSEIPNKDQYNGCYAHTLHPDLVPWQLELGSDEFTATYIIDGKPVKNGEKGLESKELIANPKACANPDRFTDLLRENFNAKITG